MSGKSNYRGSSLATTDARPAGRLRQHLRRGFGRGLALAALLLSSGLLPSPSAADTSSPTAVVNCYDQARDVVELRPRASCHGREIDDGEAAAVKARRLQKFKRAFEQKPAFATPRSHGTGFFVTGDGLVVTNHHVVDDCRGELTVATTTGEKVPARVLGSQKNIDLALLKAEIAAPAIAVFREPPTLAAGTDLVVIGYGTHTLPPIRPHLTPGRFENLLGRGTQFQMKAAVRPGNSGGPVLDRAGKVVGVVFAQLNSVKRFESTGELLRDVGFAISNPVVMAFLRHHKVVFATAADDGRRLDDRAVFDSARSFIARVSCKA